MNGTAARRILEISEESRVKDFKSLVGSLFGQTNRKKADALFKSNLQFEAKNYLIDIWKQDTGEHIELLTFIKEAGGSGAVEALQNKLLSKVCSICDHADSIRHSPADRFPGAANPNSSLPIEVQNWAIALAALKLTRSLDIEVAFQVNIPFEEAILDPDFLLALVKKNEGDDGFGSNVALAEYIEKSAPEMAYMLLIQKQFDRFEANLWTFISLKAGNTQSLIRFAKVADIAMQSSISYWRAYCDSRDRDRATLQSLLEQMAGAASRTYQKYADWDRQLRSLFRDSTDVDVRRKAYQLWDALGKEWVRSLLNSDNETIAHEMMKLRATFKEEHKLVTDAKKLIDRGNSAEALVNLQKLKLGKAMTAS
jgi:hypothetical protein